MNGPLRLAALGAALLALGLILGGRGGVAGAALEIGLPGLVAQTATTPAQRGAALFRKGDFTDAAAAFAEAGDDYNHGLAEAWAGDFATALVAWERAMAADPADRQARANHKLVAAFLSGNEFDPVARPEDKDGEATLANPGQGKGRATADGDDATNQKTGFWMPELTSDGLRSVRQQFDGQFMTANRRWLATLEDQPGAYLRARLALEQKAREHAGTALPATEDPR